MCGGNLATYMERESDSNNLQTYGSTIEKAKQIETKEMQFLVKQKPQLCLSPANYRLNVDPGYEKDSEIARDFDGAPYEVIRNSVFPDFND